MHKRSSQGFSLLEMLLTLVISTLVLGLVWGLYHAGYKTRKELKSSQALSLDMEDLYWLSLRRFSSLLVLKGDSHGLSVEHIREESSQSYDETFSFELKSENTTVHLINGSSTQDLSYASLGGGHILYYDAATQSWKTEWDSAQTHSFPQFVWMSFDNTGDLCFEIFKGQML